jgi:type IV secretion system protein VirB10
MASTGASEAPQPDDLRPVVRTGSAGNAGLWIFVGMVIVGGLLLFNALENRRLSVAEPTTAYDGAASGETITPLPPLALSENFARPPEQQLAPAALRPLIPAQPASSPRVVTRVVEVPAPASPPPSAAFASPAAAPIAAAGGPQVVYDASVRPPALTASPAATDSERVTATRLKNPSTTVPKGTVIPAVLESALDSTRAGQVRAVVTRDMMGFDGTRTLIPRGSRLYGEYAADLNYGQNRAVMRWTRLLRPDGAMINLDSPAADPLGRAGIKGKVNGHFWSRFGSAILQSTLDIGVGVATRKAVGDGYFIALPGSTQQLSNATRDATANQAQVTPTLTVRQGTSVSVFVAKDLDFSTVEK